MNSRPRARFLTVALTLLLAGSGAPAARAQVEGDPIDLVIVLDVSGTMRGLIDATRFNLWEIVNDLAEAEPTPRLRVALVTYGNQRGSRYTGWVRMETDLTEDLDSVSERLFRLRSRGADEMVGRALKVALEDLDWSESEHALKLLFIAGNEPADQDPEFQFRWMSEAAADAGVFLSAVYCGRADAQGAETWKEMAELAEGRFTTIDHRAAAGVVETPFDADLAELGDLLNGTFVPLGRPGAEEKKSRIREDKHARSLGLAVAATRAQAKGSALYSSSSDLVSRYESGELERFPVAERDLPRYLRRQEPEERLAVLAEMAELRRQILEQIADLSEQRRQFIAEQDTGNRGNSRSFGSVLRSTIRQKAEEFGYTFPQRSGA